jgi:MFS family permease
MSVLRQPGFVILWSTGALYGTQRWLEVLAVALYAFDQTGSPLVVAAMMFARMLPMVLFGSVLGTLADRLDRRRLLLIGFSSLIAIASVLAVLALSDSIELWMLAIAVFCTGIVFSADLTVRRTLLGEAAGMSRLGRALALDSATGNATRMLGPLAGGIVYEWVGLPGVYVLAAVMYVLILLLFSRYKSQPRAKPAHHMSFVKSLKDAFAYVRHEPNIKATLSITIIINVWAFPVATMVPVIGRESLELTPAWVGFLASAEGTGSFLGALLLSWRVAAHNYVRAYVVGSATFLLAVCCFAWTSMLGSAWPVLFIGGLGVAGFAAMQPTLILAFTDPAYRSRVMGLLTVCIGTGPIGILHVGLLAEWLGPNNAVMVMAVEGLLAIGWAVVRWPTLRRAGV